MQMPIIYEGLQNYINSPSAKCASEQSERVDRPIAKFCREICIVLSREGGSSVDQPIASENQGEKATKSDKERN